jgi:hypothetical protein
MNSTASGTTPYRPTNNHREALISPQALKLDQVKRLKVLEQENGRLRRAVADLTLEKLVLKEAASGNF